MTKRALIASALVAAALGVSAPASADFLGDTIQGTYDYPSLGTTFQNAGTAVVAPTAQFNFITGVINPTATVSANTIAITFAGTGSYGGVAFSGPVLTDLTQSDIIGALLTTSTVAGFDASRLTFGSNFVAFNLQGLSINSTDTILATVQFASGVVPEPATWAMMMLGFGGVGYALRRRPKNSTRIRFA